MKTVYWRLEVKKPPHTGKGEVRGTRGGAGATWRAAGRKLQELLMQPYLGWAGLRRSALKQAEVHLLVDSEGMRYEVGVLSLNAEYSSHFFPGTPDQKTHGTDPCCYRNAMLPRTSARGSR